MRAQSLIVAAAGFAMVAYLGQQEVPANVADIKVLGTQSIQLVWKEIGAKFEQTTGHKVVMTADIAAAAKRKIDGGETFDAAILTPAVIDQLIEEGKVVAGTRIDILRVGIGIAVRTGEPKPDIGSVEAFKRALLNARSIAYLKQGTSGLYLADLMKRLGIAEELKSKTILPDDDIVGPLVARGEAAVGLTALSTLRATPGVDVVGPLPPELQLYVKFTGAVSTATATPDAAGELLRFMTGPFAIPVIKSKGMEPG
jgi:molybdate transport system substrate-binding protein